MKNLRAISGVKIFEVLLHLYSPDRFKILLNYATHTKLHFKRKNEKSIFLPIFAIWKSPSPLKIFSNDILFSVSRIVFSQNQRQLVGLTIKNKGIEA